MPDLYRINSEMAKVCWPEFMRHDPVAQGFNNLFEDFSGFQIGFQNLATGEIIAIGNSIPLYYEYDFCELPVEGWDWELQKGIDDFAVGLKPNVIGAIQIMVLPNYQDSRLSTTVLTTLQKIAKQSGLNTMIAPVRPSLKCEYPITPIDSYVKWQTHEKLPFDPWLRVHARLGAQIIKVCHKSMTIQGTVADWEEWTGLKFPESGKYIIPGALNHIKIDCENLSLIHI